MILAGTKEKRAEAIAKLLPMQRSDFKEILRAMTGLPVTIRLLDHLFMNFSHLPKSWLKN